MAEKKNNDIPPIPVPPVEPAPKARAPKPKAEPAPVAPIAPLVDLTNAGTTAPHRPDPYAQAAPANPYAQPSLAAQPVAQPNPGYAQPGYAHPGQPYAYQPYPATPPQGLAVTSMILGIVGIVLTFAGIGFLAGIAAVITGHLAQKRQPYAKSFWLTGIITGYITVALGVIVIFVFVAIFVAAFASAARYN